MPSFIIHIIHNKPQNMDLQQSWLTSPNLFSVTAVNYPDVKTFCLN